MLDRSVSQHAPAARSDKRAIERQKKLIGTHCCSLKELYDAVSEMILVVNQNRQIVFFNSVVPALTGFDDPEGLYGLRPGEALGCIYACVNPGGCGTSEFCSQCGAVNAILAALSNKKDLRECRVPRKDRSEALDLLVRTTPLAVMGERFTIIAIIDISHEKRRRALERIFFHDIMNTAASINVLAEMLHTDPQGREAEDCRKNLLTGAHQLMDELRSQKQLLAAESNDLVVDRQPVDGDVLLREVAELIGNRFQGHMIEVHTPAEGLILETDRSLLHRVLGNMIQNALEAALPDGVVNVSCGVKDGFAEFRVHNDRHMPREIQLQLFQRSFSTKGPGRGLGTYSMKLLSEQYLNGRIALSSSPQAGTTFVARFPLTHS